MMKKILSGMMVAVLILSALCAGALAEAPDFTGDWYASVYGLTMTLTLNGDGSYVMQMDMEGEEDLEGTWAFDGATLVMDQGSESETTLAYDADSNSFAMEEDGMEVQFTREMPVAFEAAPARADAAIEEFAGTWVCTLIDVMGMQVPPELMEMDLGAVVDGASVTLTITQFADPVEVTLEGTLADGVLTVTVPAENEYSEETVFAMQLLEDGTMSVTTSFMDQAMVCYMSLAE